MFIFILFDFILFISKAIYVVAHWCQKGVTAIFLFQTYKFLTMFTG